MKNEINRLNKNLECIEHLIQSDLWKELKLRKGTIEDLKAIAHTLKRQKEVIKEIENMNNTYKNQIKQLKDC